MSASFNAAMDGLDRLRAENKQLLAELTAANFENNALRSQLAAAEEQVRRLLAFVNDVNKAAQENR